MDDRELLELAAKAAGVFMRPDEWPFSNPMPDDATATYYDSDAQSITGTRVWYGRNGEVGGTEDYTWSPLTDDGDALRLAVRLGFCVDIETPCGAVTAGRACETFDCDDHEAAMAATRRAIVRAAAERGRAKE